MIDNFFLYYAVVLSIIISIPFYRVIKGPSVFDRIIAAGSIGTSTIILILLVGFIYKRVDLFIDIALAYAILNFIGTLIISKYFSTKNARQ